MANIRVAEFEFTTLRDYKSTAPTARMRLRSEVIMLASRGIPDEVIAEMVDRQLSTIAQWKREFQQSRLASIRDNTQTRARGGRRGREVLYYSPGVGVISTLDQ